MENEDGADRVEEGVTAGLERSGPATTRVSSPRNPAPIDELLDGIGEGFFSLDVDWRFTSFNRAAEEIFGLSRNDVIGRRIWDVSPGVVGTEIERRYRQVMAERTRQEFETSPPRRPDRFHQIRAFPFGDGLGAAFRDITHRRQGAQALQNRERELARVQRIGGVGGWTLDLVTGVAQRSQEYLSLHGLPEALGQETLQEWLARVHPEDRAAVESNLNETLTSAQPEYVSEYRIIRASDGAVRWIRSLAEIERAEDGRAVRLVGAHLDITGRKEAEQAAKISEARLRALADALPVLISYVDRDGVFRFVNKIYEIWYGLPVAEIVGAPVRDLMGDEMYAVREPFMKRALAGETVTYEAEFRRSGRTMSTEIIHVPHRDESGAAIGMYNVVQDVTARKLTEKKVAESEERFRSIANSAPVPMWVTRLGGKRDFVNRAYCDFLGVSYDEAVDFDWRNALHPDDLARIFREQQAGEGSLRPFVLEARYRGADGAWTWLRSESQPRWGPSGEHIGFIGVAHDVTAAKQAEQALTEINQTLETRVRERTEQLTATEGLIQTFFNHSSECHAVLVQETGGYFRYEEANPATLKLYGKSRAQVIGRTVDEVFDEAVAAELNEHLTVCLAKGGAHRYERVHGDAVIEAVATPAPGEPGSGLRLLVTARDVTERRRLEEQLRQSQKMEAVGQLTGGVAHDFNNLLTIVLGGLDGIGRQTPGLDAAAAAKIERFRGIALQGTKRAAALTSRLLTFSRQQSLIPQVLDVNALVTDLCDLLRRTLGEAILLETALTVNIWRTFADPNQLENALINLAVNARDAMPDGGRLVIETANFALEADDVAALNASVAPGDYVTVAVVDTGRGMDRTVRERAFDPFFTTKDVGKGTGLGLSQVYGFARHSAGHVRIFSEVGQGATVKIYLPRKIGDPVAKKTTSGLVGELRRGSETVLIVEDEDALREYGAQVLQELGYRVLEAADGAAALRLLESNLHVDLLLTDIIMPGGVNGRQLAQLALTNRPQLKVLFMTGYAPEAMMDQTESGAADLIGKPFSFEELAARVRRSLDAS